MNPLPALPDRVFAAAAELFGLLSTPTRLRIVCELCEGERNVGELLERVEVSQPNMAQPLGMLFRAGSGARRRAGAPGYSRSASDRVLLLCDAVCEVRGSPHGKAA